MSLIQYLLTEGKKDVIIEKIGLPEHLADHVIKYYDKKFVLYWASAIASIFKFDIADGLKKPDYSFNKFVSNVQFVRLKRLENKIKDPKLPNLPKTILNQFKQTPDSPYTLFEKAEEYNDMYVTIRDYAERTNQNFQNADFVETFQEAEEWHENLEASGETIQLEGDMEVIHEFDDGHYWVDNNDNDCSIEGDAMGHCGRTNADTILSLRSPDGEPHISVAFDYDGTYRQAKGKRNRKPVEKYHQYMEWLFVNGGKYQIKMYNPEYQSGEDFTVNDLDEEVRHRVLEMYPSIDPTYAIRSIMENDSLTEQQKFNALAELDEDNEIFEGEFSNELEFDTTDDMVIVGKDIDPLDYAKSDDRVLQWSLDVIRYNEHLFFDAIDGEMFIDSIDTKRFSYDSEEMQRLLEHAKDEDLYQEAVEEFKEYEDVDESLEDYLKVDNYLTSFISFLYQTGNFDEFNIALDRIARWAYESTAYDEIYKDTIKYIKETPLQSPLGNELEWHFDFKEDYHLVSEEGEVNIKLPLYEIVDLVLNDVDFFERNYLIDAVLPDSFSESMTQPNYGYPKGGVSSQVYNDAFAEGVYN